MKLAETQTHRRTQPSHTHTPHHMIQSTRVTSRHTLHTTTSKSAVVTPHAACPLALPYILSPILDASDCSLSAASAPDHASTPARSICRHKHIRTTVHVTAVITFPLRQCAVHPAFVAYHPSRCPPHAYDVCFFDAPKSSFFPPRTLLLGRDDLPCNAASARPRELRRRTHSADESGRATSWD